MPRQPVFTEVMDALERRIASGEYMLKDLPGERKLAEQFGVSYMTARKAVLELVEREILARRPNGSLVVHPGLEARQARLRVALLTPAFPAEHLLRLRAGVARATDRRGVQSRAFEYVHWDDAIVREAIDGADGLFVIPSTEPIPPRLLRDFAAPGAKVVFLDGDLTDQGIPSVKLFAPAHLELIFEHLWELGHRRIDCLNTQGRNGEIDHRIDDWRTWLERRGGEGELFDDPTPPYEDTTSRAHEAMRRVLSERRDRLSALVCTTQPAAVGAMRACRDVGVEVGVDVSICTINNEPTGRYFCPSLTGLEMPDIEPLLEPALGWFASSDESWPDDLRISPASPILFTGESTGPARR
ncbi:MAG: hypothetical protein CMJ31_13815 [Phycisphaerae bacterium]|nr:hypothetical protein [Phycisphaerae bacterium]